MPPGRAVVRTVLTGSPRCTESDSAPAFLTPQSWERPVLDLLPIGCFGLCLGDLGCGELYFRHPGVAGVAAATEGGLCPRTHALDPSAKMSAIAVPPPGCDWGWDTGRVSDAEES